VPPQGSVLFLQQLEHSQCRWMLHISDQNWALPMTSYLVTSTIFQYSPGVLKCVQWWCVPVICTYCIQNLREAIFPQNMPPFLIFSISVNSTTILPGSKIVFDSFYSPIQLPVMLWYGLYSLCLFNLFLRESIFDEKWWIPLRYIEFEMTGTLPDWNTDLVIRMKSQVEIKI
jgi:hypothetical protein